MLLILMAALTGCDGGNLFGGDPSGTGAPEVEIVSITPADTIDEGDRLDLRLRAVSDRRVAQFDIRLRQATVLDSTVVLDEPLSDATVVATIQLPAPAADSILVITVTATDQARSVSDPVVDTLYVRDVTRPTATVVVDPASASGGETVQIEVTAEDNVGVGALGFMVLDAEGDTISLELAPLAGSIADSVTRVFDYVVPDTIPPMAVTVIGLAADLRGLTPDPPSTAALTIVDRTPPRVTIIRPTPETTYPLGDSVFVEVETFDASGVQSVSLRGLAYRGDPELGTDVTIVRYEQKAATFETAVQDTVLRRYLRATSDRTSEVVSIIASVTDAVGNVGTDTVDVSVGGPRVLIESPLTGDVVQAGRTVGVRLVASDPSTIESMQLAYTGVTSDTLRFDFSPMPDSAVVDTAIAIPAGASGTLELVATAYNAFGILGRGEPVELTVQNDVVPDATRPTVSVIVSGRSRMEVDDTVLVRVQARDNDGGTGLDRVGFTALAINSARTDTLTQSASVTYGVPRSGGTVAEFTFVPFNVDSLALPDSLTFLIHAFAVDDAGNCSAAVSAMDQQLDCAAFEGDTVAANSVGEPVDAVVVAGRTVMLPDGGQIADATVDTLRQRLYLSNFSARKVEVLDLVADTFNSRGVDVGASPWGIGLNRTEDTLVVANSGGTNISFIPLDGPLVEDGARRLRTPNIVLFQILKSKDEFGFEEYQYVGRNGDDFISFSDRPQFVAQDAMGIILYSTVPTGAAQEGTIRFVVPDPEPATLLDTPEAKLLFTSKAIESNPSNVAIAHVDSLLIYDGPSDMIEIWDHKFGFPDSVISSGVAPIEDAVANLMSQGSDIYTALGSWNVAEIAMSDTTFLALSGDRQWVAFGDGATVPFAQIIMWKAADRSISNDIHISDIIENAAERVRGIGLNGNGTLGVAKGSEGVYFFDTGLRLQGELVDPFTAGGAGAVLHPSHPDYETLAASSEQTLAFAGTGRNSIQIIDTWHFRSRGEIYIRDTIAGPLRATLPTPADLSDPACTADPQQCTVVKLYGVTDAGGVVIVDVLRRDILN